MLETESFFEAGALITGLSETEIKYGANEIFHWSMTHSAFHVVHDLVHLNPYGPSSAGS